MIFLMMHIYTNGPMKCFLEIYMSELRGRTSSTVAALFIQHQQQQFKLLASKAVGKILHYTFRSSPHLASLLSYC